MSNSLQPYGLQPARLLCPWDSLGNNTEVDCHALLYGIFPTHEPASLTSPALAGRFFTTSATWEAQEWYTKVLEYHSVTSFIEKKIQKNSMDHYISEQEKKMYASFYLRGN